MGWPKGQPQSEESNAKRRAALKGRAFSADHVAALLAGRRAAGGWKVSPEHRARISATLKGRKPSAACIEKLRARRMTPSQRDAFVAAGKRYNTGRPKDPAVVERIAAQNRGRKWPPEQRLKLAQARVGFCAARRARYPIPEQFLAHPLRYSVREWIKQGFTPDEIQRHLDRLEVGTCEVCGQAEQRAGAKGQGFTRLILEHNHQTGRYRGTVCHTCNMVLGHSKDSPDLLRHLANYLERNA